MKLYTQGTFDLFHYGHVNFLWNCKRLAKEVTVALLSDESIEIYKGNPPIMNFDEREAVLKGCRYVTDVIKSDNKNTKSEIINCGADIVAVGSDWAKKDIYKQYGIEEGDKEWLNYLLIYIPYTDSISTTELKRRIEHGKI